MEYRKDIQILRGVAVLLVVLFHFEVAGFESGFLGVDVFFVISGYLMAKLYDPSQKLDFFVKRAKRLLPAYFAVVAVTTLVAAARTIPSDYFQVATQARFAAFFASNIGFWLENSYFDKAAFLPLLHLWSLGVEIQFYLLIPALVWMFGKWRVAYPTLLVASALLCFLVVGISPKTSFFWLPARLWEFLIGFGVARYAVNRWSLKHQASQWLGLLCLALVFALALVNIDADRPGFVKGHPGLLALLSTLATAAVLTLGIPRRVEATSVATALEKMGSYSYSIYLAHFPIIVLSLYRPFGGTVLETKSIAHTAIIAIVVAGASVLLYRFVEQPFRRRAQGLRWIVAPAVVVIGLSFLGTLAQQQFIPTRDMLIYQAWFDRSEFRCGKLRRVLHPTAISCEITKPIAAPAHRVLLVGNSYADSIKTTFASTAERRNVSVHFLVNNRPLVAGGLAPSQVIGEAEARQVDAIVMHFSLLGTDLDQIGRLVQLARQRNISVSFLLPPPTWNDHVPLMLWKNRNGLSPLPHQDLHDYARVNADLIAKLSKIDYEKFVVYGTAEAFCNRDCRLVSASGKPYYFDGGHLTLTGSEALREVFEHVIDDL
ncbi:MAG TPA: acyltransferase family protein [Steroidobacter sp.]|uniref:acyltransferase family protein n=1 Tax=Steroidobacter sp. TaxID=1978227 RepID=UPI002ED9CB51